MSYCPRKKILLLFFASSQAKYNLIGSLHKSYSKRHQAAMEIHFYINLLRLLSCAFSVFYCSFCIPFFSLFCSGFLTLFSFHTQVSTIFFLFLASKDSKTTLIFSTALFLGTCSADNFSCCTNRNDKMTKTNF